MREITPYATVDQLSTAIDNGGHFYNLFSSPGDQVVSTAELAKAAGVWSSGASAFLFLEMAQAKLDDKDRHRVEQMLEPKLQTQYQQQRPANTRPSDVELQGAAGTAMIVEGWPRFVENKSQFNGFIMIPISTGTTTSFMMLPIYDAFDLYELFDDKSHQGPAAIIAVPTGTQLDAQQAIRFGGVLRELQTECGEPASEHPFYLEAQYFTPLG